MANSNDLVTVKALSTVSGGTEETGTKTYEAGDTFQVTVKEARDLANVGAVELDQETEAKVSEYQANQDAASSPVGPTTLAADNTVSTAGLKSVTSQPLEAQPTTPEEFQQPKLSVMNTVTEAEQNQPTQEQLDRDFEATGASSTQQNSAPQL